MLYVNPEWEHTYSWTNADTGEMLECSSIRGLFHSIFSGLRAGEYGNISRLCIRKDGLCYWVLYYDYNGGFTSGLNIYPLSLMRQDGYKQARLMAELRKKRKG